MRIESIIKRASGTEVVLDRTRYLFRPLDPTDAASPHVCDVSDEDHVATFLRISEGYREYEEGAAPAELRIVAPAPEVQKKGRELSPIQAALEEEDNERDAALSEQSEFLQQLAAANAETAAALSRQNDAAFAAAIREETGFTPGAKLAGEPGADEAEYDGDGALTLDILAAKPLDELRVTYEAFVGIAPNPRSTRDFLIKGILKK